ncbi:DUF5819 family protein [Saccharomonospora glauca]|uniref:Uncharacterized protein n=1 Tax=Saccharomonospora glauca K62 TaxID=928724 RepID=I1D0R0_9PSEU|nr:DUF5819 family protein [Saccharomonospora glauca]EIE98534.1 hypothetical protein SacglDRAFT_01619 [Saccharomonospora glauca K62]
MAGKKARAALYAFFATWFGLTVAGQKLYRDDNKKSFWDRLYLVVADWRFFAPNPGIHDHHLLMRDKLSDGTLTEWTEIRTVEERTLRHAVWHPHRRAEKTVFDTAAELLRFIGQHGPMNGNADPTVQLSVPYLTLLAHVTTRRHHPDAVQTQFLIAVSGGYDEEDEPTMVFLSEFHALSPKHAELGRTNASASVSDTGRVP